MDEIKAEFPQIFQPQHFTATLDAETSQRLLEMLDQQDQEYLDALFAGKTTLDLRRDGKYITLMPVNRLMLSRILMDYFTIGNSYTYELTRDKSAFGIGTMTFDDFNEWDEEQIADLTEYIIKRLKEGCMSSERGFDEHNERA